MSQAASSRTSASVTGFTLFPYSKSMISYGTAKMTRQAVRMVDTTVHIHAKNCKKKMLLLKNSRMKNSEMLLLTTKPNPRVIVCFCL